MYQTLSTSFQGSFACGDVSWDVQIAGLMTNLTQEYTNFLNFLTTAPSAFNVFKNDAALLNAQINAVSDCISCTLAPLMRMPNVRHVRVLDTL